jgi:ribosome-binding ATPase
LGNQFLESIRHCQIVIQLVRCFEDPMIVHVEASVDPVRDIQIVQNELILKDLQLASVLKRRKPKGVRKYDPSLTSVSMF